MFLVAEIFTFFSSALVIKSPAPVVFLSYKGTAVPARAGKSGRVPRGVVISNIRPIGLNLATEASTGIGCLLPAALTPAHCPPVDKIEEQIIECFDQLRMPVYRYLVGMHLVPQDADEVIQETFLKLYEQLSRGGQIENIRGWTFRVAHNLAINGLKGRKHLAPMTDEQWESVVQTREDPRPGPEEQLLDKEKMAHIHDTLGKLSRLQRQCVHLRIEGFRYREIAEILEVSVPSVAESLRRAIVKLAVERHG